MAQQKQTIMNVRAVSMQIARLDRSLDRIIMSGLDYTGRFHQLEREREWCVDILESLVPGSAKEYAQS